MNEIVDYDYNKKKLRKITCDWYEENTKKLIKCVQNHRILWDTNHPNHKKKTIREHKWKLVCKELFNDDKLTGEVCLKWHSLRSQYTSNNKKYKTGGHNNNIKWKYYSMLQFLSAQPDTTPFIENTIVKSELDIPCVEPNNNTIPCQDDNISVESESICDKNIELNFPIETTKPPAVTVTNSCNDVQEFSDTNNISSSSSNYNISISDEYTDFGKFVANELRSLKYASDLESKLKRQIQRYIVDIADEYALRLLNNKTIKLESSLSSTSITTSSSETNYFT